MVSGGRRDRRTGIGVLLLLLVTLPGVAQQDRLDLNSYYQFPVSLGAEYQSLMPATAYPWGAPYSVFDISLNVRVPIRPLPVLQPLGRIGATWFDSQSQTEPPLKWDHADVYGVLGLGYSHRFARYFEVGAELLGGASFSLFSNLVPVDDPPLIAPNVLFEAGARISLNPSYNFTIEIHPSARYTLGLGALKEFDGLLLGLGFHRQFPFRSGP